MYNPYSKQQNYGETNIDYLLLPNNPHSRITPATNKQLRIPNKSASLSLILKVHKPTLPLICHSLNQNDSSQRYHNHYLKILRRHSLFINFFNMKSKLNTQSDIN
uniref:Uncharacterized protein n=1 Tax=Opuntia streptacantha TaxID=393608 RepID=A0A7C8Z0D8_OPUST